VGGVQDGGAHGRFPLAGVGETVGWRPARCNRAAVRSELGIARQETGKPP
jgi:hypothetical protein